MRRTLIAGLLAGVLALAGCAADISDQESSDAAAGSVGGSADAGSAEPYRIVHLLGQNQAGAGALNAKAAAQAAKAAVAVLNEGGGVLGRTVELEIIDTGGDPTTAVTKLQERLASGPKPNLVLPGNTSAEALPMAPIITEAKVMSVQQAGASDLNDPEKFPYLFQIVPTNESMAVKVGQYIQEHKAARVAMIAGKDAFGQATAEATRTALADAGIELVGDETYTAEDLDMTAQLERLKATDPDVVFMQGAGSPIGYVLESRAKLGWTDVPLIADSTSAVTSLLSQPAPDGLVGTDATENVSVQVLAAAINGSEAVNAGAVETMVDALKAQGEINLPLNVYFVYDGIMLAAAAAEQAGTADDAEKLATTLEGFTGDEAGNWALSKYAYSADSHAVAVDPGSTEIIPATELIDGRYTIDD